MPPAQRSTPRRARGRTRPAGGEAQGRFPSLPNPSWLRRPTTRRSRARTTHVQRPAGHNARSSRNPPGSIPTHRSGFPTCRPRPPNRHRAPAPPQRRPPALPVRPQLRPEALTDLKAAEPARRKGALGRLQARSPTRSRRPRSPTRSSHCLLTRQSDCRIEPQRPWRLGAARRTRLP